MGQQLLELFSGANSLFSALERVYLLRSFSVVSIMTAILWLLSPLGGQAFSPRLLMKESFYANSTQEATYLGSDFLNSSLLDPISVAASFLPRVTTVYLSSLSSSADVRASPRDVWGNPKLSIADWNAGEADSNGWKSVAVTNDSASYTNLLGIPVKAFGDRTASEFTVPLIDLKVRCSSVELTDTETFRKNLKEPLALTHWGGGTHDNGTTSIVFPGGYFNSGIATSFLFIGNTSWNRFVNNRTQPIKIFYGSMTLRAFDATEPTNATMARGLPISLATCTMLPRGLESKVACEGQVCRAVAARSAPANLQEIMRLMGMAWRGYFCMIGSSRHPNEAGQTDEFLMSGAVSDVQYALVKLHEVPLVNFERRFEQVLNTFYYASSSQIFLAGNLSSSHDGMYARRATAAVTEDLGLRYVCHWLWFGIAAAVVVLLEVVAIVNAVLRFRTRTPDIFGYVSSLAIGNKYCEDRGLEVSSALDGLERARALGRVRFQLADVRGADDVGRVAFVPRGGADEVEASRVRFDRYYD